MNSYQIAHILFRHHNNLHKVSLQFYKLFLYMKFQNLILCFFLSHCLNYI